MHHGMHTKQLSKDKARNIVAIVLAKAGKWEKYFIAY
jgi:hypothetical protein